MYNYLLDHGVSDDREVARWDVENQAWNLIGGDEGEPPEGITVISDRLPEPKWMSQAA